MASVRAESTWEKYNTFLNSFYPEIKRLTIELAETMYLSHLIA